MWKNLYVSGSIGSEGGIILADEEYKDACRITLEKCEKYCAVTCGVYGAMVHTAFAAEVMGYPPGENTRSAPCLSRRRDAKKERA